MKANYEIALIGTGNLAFHLAPALENVGCRVSQVYGRDLKKAKQIESTPQNLSAFWRILRFHLL